MKELIKEIDDLQSGKKMAHADGSVTDEKDTSQTKGDKE